MCSLEPMSGLDGNTINKPLDLQVCIIDRFNPALQMGVVSLLQSLTAVQRCDEDGFLAHFLYRGWLRALVRLQFTDLLETVLIQGTQLKTSVS